MLDMPVSDKGKPIKPLGLAWYATPEAYAAMKEVCIDMPDAPYEDWKAEAERALSDAPSGAQPRLSVPVDPEDFAQWCAQKRCVANGLARQRYVHDRVDEAFGAALKAYKATRKPMRLW